MRQTLPLLLLLAAVGFGTLGLWQLHRLSWKQALLAQTSHNLQAPEGILPPPSLWPSTGPHNQFQRVVVTGTYQPSATTPVLASTRYGRGYWVLTPFATTEGSLVFINRGFVPEARKTSLPPPPQGLTTVHGLLRLTEPNGFLFLRNNPTQNRWYSRDVTAIAHAHNLQTAPFFLDRTDDGTEITPLGGLTVTTFPNHHLQYALTWFALAALSLTGLALTLKKPKS